MIAGWRFSRQAGTPLVLVLQYTCTACCFDRIARLASRIELVWSPLEITEKMPKKLGQKRGSTGSDTELLTLLQAFASSDVDDCIEHLRSFRNKSYSRTSVATLRKQVERALNNPRLTVITSSAPREGHIEVNGDSTSGKDIPTWHANACTLLLVALRV